MIELNKRMRCDMKSEDTLMFDVNEVNERLIKTTLEDAVEALTERGYNPINQLVGYIISGDLGYISSYKETRNKLSKIDRSTLVEVILKEYLK